MAISKDKGAIRKWGGGIMYYKEVNDDGSNLSSPDTFHTLCYIQESKLSDVTEIEDIHDETGAIVSSDEANRTVKLTGLFMQTDKDVLDFLKETVRGKYYAIYQYQGIVNGKYQEIFYPICKIKPIVDVASGVKRPPFEITILNNDAQIALSSALPSGAHAASFTVPINGYYLVAETAV